MGKLKIFLGASVLVLSSVVNATIIDFESYPTQNLGASALIDGVLFSIASPTDNPQVRIFNNSSTRTAYILGCELPGSGCVMDLEVDFGQAVTNLSFDFLADENIGVSGTVSAYLDSILLSTVTMFGDGDGDTNGFLSLAALGEIDRLIFNPSDPAGLGYDNFSFDVSVSVPEPSIIYLMVAGLMGFGFARRRAKR